jgi:hypothetical protein
MAASISIRGTGANLRQRSIHHARELARRIGSALKP